MEDLVCHIDSLEDPRVEVYRDIKGRDLAGRGALFILEGENSIQNLVNYGRIPLKSVLLSERRLEPMRPLLKVICAQGVPVYVLKQEVLEALVGFHFHRGVLGCGEKLPSLGPREFLSRIEGTGPLIIAEQMSNLDNVGALFRNAAAFGARAIMFDEKSSDPYYRKSLRVSGGHALAIPFSRTGTIKSIIEAAQAQGLHVIALVTPHADCKKIRSLVDYRSALFSSSKRPIAILLGAEGPGLSKEAMALADACVTIPMAKDVDSLNVATSAAVALFEITAHQSNTLINLASAATFLLCLGASVLLRHNRR